MKHVSYSQYNVYRTCPHQWKTIYIDGHRISAPNIHFIFGTALHEVLQLYLTHFYVKTEKDANELDAQTLLQEKMIGEFDKYKSEGYENFTTANELSEYYMDGVHIIDWFKKHRKDYFSKKGWKLVGCEVPIDLEIRPGITFVAYLDIVLENDITGKVRIVDFKKSYRGWSPNQKKDPVKRGQLQLYKHFYSKKFNKNLDDIEIEFIILKQKIYNYGDFAPKRVQRFAPPQSGVTIKKLSKDFYKFVDEVFNEDGTYNTNLEYKKIPSDKNCKYCPFAKTEYCDQIAN